jgi:tetratricopeptide (TPR) repeat protein
MSNPSQRKASIRLVAVGIVVTLAGCSAPQSSSTRVVDRVILEPPENQVALSPEEQTRLFDEAWKSGEEAVERGQYGIALAAFEQAAQLRPDSVEALFNLGACYEQLGDPMRAIGLYRKVLAARPDDADCYANLGTSYIKMYYREKTPAWRRMARGAWRQSLQLNSDQPQVRRYLALAGGE